MSHIKLWSKPIINAEWWWTLYSPAKPKCKSHQLNKEQRKREKKLMEKQTICTNDANTNENIYYFIHVWHATANKLWQNFMGENITAAVGAKQKCESTSFLCVFPKETVPEKWQRRGEMNKHKARITPIWSQANKYGWWRWNLLIKVEQSSNNWNGSITSIEPIQKKNGSRHGKSIDPAFPYWF